jgi:hypothetical protein
MSVFAACRSTPIGGEDFKMLTLREVPDPRNADFWDDTSGSDRSINIIVWPADIGSKLVRVRVGLMALGEFDGNPLGIHTGEIEAALTRVTVKRPLVRPLCSLYVLILRHRIDPSNRARHGRSDRHHGKIQPSQRRPRRRGLSLWRNTSGRGSSI